MLLPPSRISARLSGPVLASLALLIAGSFACGGHPADALRPKAPNFAPKEGVVELAHEENGERAEPLIVDWPSTARGKLEAQLKSGLAAVVYDGKALRLLGRCRAKGAYAYVGVTPKKDALVLRNEEDLRVKVPLGAADISTKLRTYGELKVSMTLVGRLEADHVDVRAQDLEGDCVGATHVVGSVSVGAFKFYAGTGADVEAAATTLLATGAAAKSTSDGETLNRDGDEAACTGRSDGGPPEGCGALLQIEILPLQKRLACAEGTELQVDRCVKVEPVLAASPMPETAGAEARSAPPKPKDISVSPIALAQFRKIEDEAQRAFASAYAGAPKDVMKAHRTDVDRALAYENRFLDVATSCGSPDCVAFARVKQGMLYDRLQARLERADAPEVKLLDFRQEAMVAAMERTGRESIVAKAQEIRDAMSEKWQEERENEVRGAAKEAIRDYADAVALGEQHGFWSPDLDHALVHLAYFESRFDESTLRAGTSQVRGLAYARELFTTRAFARMPKKVVVGAEQVVASKSERLRKCQDRVKAKDPQAQGGSLRLRVHLDIAGDVANVDVEANSGVSAGFVACAVDVIRSAHFGGKDTELAPREDVLVPLSFR